MGKKNLFTRLAKMPNKIAQILRLKTDSAYYPCGKDTTDKADSYHSGSRRRLHTAVDSQPETELQ